MPEHPRYPISSVGHALDIIRLLQHGGPQRVRDVADSLDVSPSTAHRLLAMLVSRGFAEQGPDRRYYPGHATQRTILASAAVAALRRSAQAALQTLARESRESVNLAVVSGTSTCMVMSVESREALRVSDRTGVTLPAHRTSGGKAVLATLSPRELERRYTHIDGIDVAELATELREVREAGFAINDQGTEPGVTAIGVVVSVPEGYPPAAVSIAMPSARFELARTSAWHTMLRSGTERIASELARRRGRAPRHDTSTPS